MGREKATLAAAYEFGTPEQLAGIAAVAMDMREPHQKFSLMHEFAKTRYCLHHQLHTDRNTHENWALQFL